ncbi:hypothetical protein [Streptomyces rhizosphaerihabitans]|uniref:hypothetical protein n=1 Tax=Streptomyces rhizosphaerihabitans TaxID=1266770 RepID=UPI0021C0BF6D|nr:hypothetical protein [Streptomyces rhizosphaerihabitans]MCT9006507.1 hypothetical protein [Streptomyces rhizosphaerihabitans]
MKRRSLPVAAAFAATTALLLTACGGGGDSSKGNDKITGADTGATKTSASPSASDTTSRPRITLPKDLSDRFENWRTGDGAKDAVLADVERRVDTTNYAITEGNAQLPALGFYYTGTALADARDWVTSIVKDGYSITGVNRYYNAKVDVFDSASAGVVYCEDQSKAFAKNRKSSKVYKTGVTDKSYVLYATRLEKNKQGVWQTTKLTSQRGHKSCTP